MPVIKNIGQKLLGLLDESFKDSERVVSDFKSTYPSDWDHLKIKYGESSETPGTGVRKEYYSAEVYLADRLSDLYRMGLVEREYVKNPNYKSEIGNWRINAINSHKKKSICGYENIQGNIR